MELKFRFWLGHTKKMTHEHSISEISKVIPEFTKDIIPLQYIGIKDKNGKEIYVGDIIDSQVQPRPMAISVYGFHGYQFKIGKALFCRADAIYGEVIGNIYENPEILLDDRDSDE